MGLFGPNIKKMLEEKDTAGLKKVVLEDRNQKIRVKAIEALAELRKVTTLISLMADPVLMTIIVPFLVKMGDKVVKSLIKALKNKDYYIQGGAATTLSIIGDYQAIEPLIINVKDKNCKARIPMIVALGKFGGEEAKEALREATRDKNPEVSNAAMLALGEILNKGM